MRPRATPISTLSFWLIASISGTERRTTCIILPRLTSRVHIHHQCFICQSFLENGMIYRTHIPNRVYSRLPQIIPIIFNPLMNSGSSTLSTASGGLSSVRNRTFCARSRVLCGIKFLPQENGTHVHAGYRVGRWTLTSRVQPQPLFVVPPLINFTMWWHGNG